MFQNIIDLNKKITYNTAEKTIFLFLGINGNFVKNRLFINFMNIHEQKDWWHRPMKLFGELTGWIAGPIIIALFVGRRLDDRYHTEPWLFLLCVGFAFLISNIAIVKKTLQYIKELETEAKNKQKPDKMN